MPPPTAPPSREPVFAGRGRFPAQWDLMWWSKRLSSFRYGWAWAGRSFVDLGVGGDVGEDEGGFDFAFVEAGDAGEGVAVGLGNDEGVGSHEGGAATKGSNQKAEKGGRRTEGRAKGAHVGF